MPVYKVVKPVGILSERREKDEQVELTVEVAENIGVGEYLVPVVAPPVAHEGTEEAPETPDEGNESADAPEAPESTESTPEGEPESTEETPETPETTEEPTVENEEVPEGHVPHVVTEEDLANNPELVEQGVKVGETIYLPEVSEEEPTVDAEAPAEGTEPETQA